MYGTESTCVRRRPPSRKAPIAARRPPPPPPRSWSSVNSPPAASPHACFPASNTFIFTAVRRAKPLVGGRSTCALPRHIIRHDNIVIVTQHRPVVRTENCDNRTYEPPAIVPKHSEPIRVRNIAAHNSVALAARPELQLAALAPSARGWGTSFRAIAVTMARGPRG